MLPLTDNDPTSGLCVPVVEACSVLRVRAPLALTVDSDCVEYTDVPPGGTTGLAAVGRSNRGVSKLAEEVCEEHKPDGLFVGLLCFPG